MKILIIAVAVAAVSSLVTIFVMQPEPEYRVVKIETMAVVKNSNSIEYGINSITADGVTYQGSQFDIMIK